MIFERFDPHLDAGPEYGSLGREPQRALIDGKDLLVASIERISVGQVIAENQRTRLRFDWATAPACRR